MLTNSIRALPIGESPLVELKLIYNESDAGDMEELRDILSKRLTYPSSTLAELHMEANKLGTLDLWFPDLASDESRVKKVNKCIYRLGD
jgi:hypothetical protein